MKQRKIDELKIVNIGLEGFYTDLKSQSVEVLNVEWRPPADVNSDSIRTIDNKKELIDEANSKAVEIIKNGKAVLTGLGIALDTIPGMHKNLILHSGPPVKWEDMSGPTQGAILGALVYERRAKDIEEAEQLVKSGEIEFAPCHNHDAVGPMAGIISPSMPVFIIKNETYDNYAYSTQNEGLGKVLRFGAYQPEVIEKLHWMEEVLYPILDKAIKSLGKIDLNNLIAQALHMGDEVHNRNRAGTSLLYRQLAPAIIRTADNKEDGAKVLDFINGNDHFFLNLTMPAAKCILDAARDIENSSVVIAMARNGTEFGIQLSGTGREWFTGQALIPDALFFPGYTKDDACRDIGDSTITETLGLGGFAIAAAPAIVQFVGGTVSDAIRYNKMMYEITTIENNNFQIPALNFRGLPTGIDVRKVISQNLTPFLNTGVAHKNPGIGQIGAGILQAPIEPFIKAYEKLSNKLKEK